MAHGISDGAPLLADSAAANPMAAALYATLTAHATQLLRRASALLMRRPATYQEAHVDSFKNPLYDSQPQPGAASAVLLNAGPAPAIEAAAAPREAANLGQAKDSMVASYPSKQLCKDGENRSAVRSGFMSWVVAHPLLTSAIVALVFITILTVIVVPALCSSSLCGTKKDNKQRLSDATGTAAVGTATGGAAGSPAKPMAGAAGRVAGTDTGTTPGGPAGSPLPPSSSPPPIRKPPIQSTLPQPPSPPPPPPRPPPFQGNGTFSGLCPDTDAIFAQTNVYRVRHQAPPLVWSDSLAASAIAYSRKLATTGCSLIHSTTGENLLRLQRYPSPDTTCMVGMRSWYAEVMYYNFSTTFPFQSNWYGSKMVGHFTQTVWVGTSSMGCGVTVADYPINSGTRTYMGGCKIIVCHYKPPGNLATDQAFLINVLRNTSATDL